MAMILTVVGARPQKISDIISKYALNQEKKQ